MTRNCFKLDQFHQMKGKRQWNFELCLKSSTNDNERSLKPPEY
jgi:hypothetical protein